VGRRGTGTPAQPFDKEPADTNKVETVGRWFVVDHATPLHEERGVSLRPDFVTALFRERSQQTLLDPPVTCIQK